MSKKRFVKLIRIQGEYARRVEFKDSLDKHGVKYTQYHNNIGQEFIFHKPSEYAAAMLLI
ncbi:MAG: hypothetical protein M0R77_18905 [Gammaproteobacteria bacterium]|nr:hypothetical protein [Gammaproteobacteria bacterium]